MVLDGAMHGADLLAHVEKVPVPTLEPGDIVVMDNVPDHRSAAARDAIRRAGAALRALPPHSPEFNPIGMAISKPKACLQRRAARTVTELREAIGQATDNVTPAESDVDEAAIEEARTRLRDPIGLFGIPSQASCVLETVTVSPVGHDLGMDDDHHTDSDQDEYDENADETETFHAEFDAQYELRCANPAQIESLTFTYFDVFRGAEELELTVITEAGQSRHEVTREEPTVRLGGE